LTIDNPAAMSRKWDVSFPGVPLFVTSYRRTRVAGVDFFADRLRIFFDLFDLLD
jgi:hypothetical protein